MGKTKKRLRVVRKRKSRKGLFRVIAVLLLMVLVWGARGIWQELKSVRGDPATVVATVGTLEDVVSTEAVVIRNDTIVTAPCAGRLRIYAPEGSQVGTGERVARVAADPTVAAAARAQLTQAQNTIDQLTQKSAQTERAQAEVATGNRDELKDAVQKLRSTLRTGSGKDTAPGFDRLKETLNHQKQVVDQHAVWLQNWTKLRNQAQTKALTARRALDNLESDIFAPSPGAVSYRFDGFDTSLVLPNATHLTPATLAKVNPVPSAIHDGDVVQAGQAIFRIDDQFQTHLAIPLTERQAAPIALEGKILRLRIHGSAEPWVNATVVRIDRSPQTHQLVLLCRLSVELDELASQRKVLLRVVRDQAQGIVLPEAAIGSKMGQTGVYWRRGGAFHFVPVQVQIRLNGQMVVTSNDKEDLENTDIMADASDR